VNAVFGQVALAPGFLSDVNLAAGFRYNAPSFGQSALVWNAQGGWNITPDLYIKGMVGTAFRLPTAEELFANDPNDERGDPNIKAETSTNANLSVGGDLFAIHWEVIGFYRDVTNLIGYVSFDPTTNQNLFGNLPGTVRVRGGEVVLDAALSQELSGSVSYTYSPATQAGVQAPEIPESLGKATLDYHSIEWPFGLLVQAEFVGHVYDNVAGETHVPYGDYIVFNVSGRYFFDPERHHRLDLTVKNLFDTRYTTSLLTQGISDTTGAAYVVPSLGQPRMFLLRYTYAF
jgi:vitamin B12 transporter